MPKLRTEQFGSGSFKWLGSDHGIRNARTSVLKLSAFTKDTHYPDGYIRSGTPVDATNEAAVVPWAGTGRLGFVLTDQAVVGTADLNAPVLRHGTVKVAELPVPLAPVPTDQAEFVFIGGN